MKIFVITLLACGIAFAQGNAKPAPPAAKKAAPARPSLLNPASLRAKAPDLFTVKMTTTKGDVMIQVHRGWAPMGADRFYNLIRGGYYKDAAFFRVIPGFVAQFGIAARPDVTAVWEKARLIDDRVLESNKRGTVVFATAGPNTRTTQIFINYRDNTPLDRDGFAPFGEVTEGMEVVDRFFSGYGEAPDQGRITMLGKPYLDKNFPNLDRIVTAVVMPAEAAPATPAKQ
jgi:peptidyl-prolyl cis-trans isomerase A (cyclophilin A)